MIHNQPSPVLVMIVDDQLQVDVGDDDRKLTYEKWLAQISDFHRIRQFGLCVQFKAHRSIIRFDFK